MKTKLQIILSLGVLLLISSCSKDNNNNSNEDNDQSTITLSICDKNATTETKALYANLWNIKTKGFMFGHQCDLMYGRYWYGDEGGSDTKAVCGDYPGVYASNLSECIDDRYADNPDENALRIKTIIEAYDRGMVNLVSTVNLNNPLTGGDCYDNSSDQVLSEILKEGSATNIKYKIWLDRLADIVNNLRGSDNKLIPLVFRIFHEHTQTWPWWGKNCATDAEFIAAWRYTIQYLRDTKNVHNLIYAISPQMDTSIDEDYYLYKYPGDEWVDFLGGDCYQGLNPTIFSYNMRILHKISTDKTKPCGITETGVEGFTSATYWTDNIYLPSVGKEMSMIVTWRNAYVGLDESNKHYFSVYPGHPSEADFVKMYNSDLTYFCNDLPNMYIAVKGIEVK